MWVLLVTLCVIIPPAALKESESVQDIPEGDRKLLIELVKRLQNDKTLGQLDWNESGTRKPSQQARCEVSPRRSSIIKRKDSEKYGAKNLGYFEDVKTNEACADLCCQNSSCDLAVYEDKDRHYCYLFRCEGKCIFSHHSSYISTDVTHHSGPSTTAENTEQDLHRPNEEDEEEGGDDSDQDNEPPAAIPTKPAPATTHASQFIRAHSVGLNGYCRLDTHCEDPNAGCISHECVCQEGYYKKAHICRKVCLPSSFACLELGTIGRGPHCVAGSQVCDGTTQCADGSDEFNCPDTEQADPAQDDKAINFKRLRLLGSSHLITKVLFLCLLHICSCGCAVLIKVASGCSACCMLRFKSWMIHTTTPVPTPRRLAGAAPLSTWQQQAQSKPQRLQPVPPQQPAISQPSQPQPSSQTQPQMGQQRQPSGPLSNSYSGGQYSSSGLSQTESGVGQKKTGLAQPYQQPGQQGPGMSPHDQQQPQAQQYPSAPPQGYPVYDQHPVGAAQSQPKASPASRLDDAYSSQEDRQQALGQGQAAAGGSLSAKQQLPSSARQPAASQQTYQEMGSDSRQPYQSGSSQRFPPSRQSQQGYFPGGSQQLAPSAGSQPQYQPDGSQQIHPSASSQQMYQPGGSQNVHPSAGSQHAYQSKGSQQGPSASSQQTSQSGNLQQGRQGSALQQAYQPVGEQKSKQLSGNPSQDSVRPSHVAADAPGSSSSSSQGRQFKSDTYQEGGMQETPQQQSGGQQNYQQRHPQIPQSKSQQQPSKQASAPQTHLKPSAALSTGNSNSKAHLEAELQKPSSDSDAMPDPQKSYIVPGHRLDADELDSSYPAQGKGVPEKPHPHTAYDVRIGGKKTSEATSDHKAGLNEKSYVQPSEMESQQSPQYFSPFGDQYMQQPVYSQQFPVNSNGYQNPYVPNAGSQSNRYQNLAEQFYPGSRGQQGYPQQGYLGFQDLGYPSQYSPPHYEFGEFEPPYSETDSFVNGHDNPPYQPNYKQGAYESPFAQDKNGADKSPKQDSESQPSSKAQVAQQGGSSSQDSHKGEKQQTDINGADSGIKDASHNLDEDGSSEPDLPQSVDKAPSSSANSDSMEKEGAVDHKSAATGSDDSLVDEESHDGGLPDKESGKDTQKAEQSASSDGSSYFSKLKLDFTKETASMQGPIIALSLGLAFTVILLVFVACRLRNVRRRLRKGRPLHSNEADYLINGMYL
ncbi:hypothetical protein BaRGS_00028415 [Batillaria attramentaria]|uniref:MANSC domain-containing protein n=1 Tax=Batillaria attramentaria TaxID=370345 RepID=A0ABD0JZY6_9CAEN